MGMRIARLLLPASSLASAAGALATILLASKLMQAEEFSHFSISLSVGQLICVIGFEWLRLSVLRYWQEGANEATPADIRKAIGWLYQVCLVVVFAAAGVAVVLSQFQIAAMALIAGTTAVLDWRQTWARSTYSDAAYVATSLLRAILTPLTCALCIAWSPSSMGALVGYAAGQALTAAVSLLLSHGGIRLEFAPPGMRQLRVIVLFGVAMSVAAALSAAVFTVARVFAVQTAGLEASYGFLVAMDLSQRMFFSGGSAASLLTFPAMVRAYATGQMEAFLAASRKHFFLLWMLLVPPAVVLVTVDDVWVRFLGVPKMLVGECILAVLGCSILALRNFAVDATFMVRADFRSALQAPLIGLGGLAVLLVSGQAVGAGAATVPVALLLSSLVSACYAIVLSSLKQGSARWVPWLPAAATLLAWLSLSGTYRVLVA